MAWTTNIPKLRSNCKPQASRQARGYNAEYDRIRPIVLAEEPVCRLCGTAWSQHVHHIDRNPHNHARANLCGLCPPCHRRIHRVKC